MGEKVKSELIQCAKKWKYFSSIADYTPNVSNVEQQLSLTIRFMELSYDTENWDYMYVF